MFTTNQPCPCQTVSKLSNTQHPDHTVLSAWPGTLLGVGGWPPSQGPTASPKWPRCPRSSTEVGSDIDPGSPSGIDPARRKDDTCIMKQTRKPLSYEKGDRATRFEWSESLYPNLLYNPAGKTNHQFWRLNLHHNI